LFEEEIPRQGFSFRFFVVDFGAVHWKEPGGLIWHTLVRSPGYGMAMVRRKASRMVVCIIETNISMIEVRGDPRMGRRVQGVNEWNQCPVFPLDDPEYPQAGADGSKLEELTCSRPVTL